MARNQPGRRTLPLRQPLARCRPPRRIADDRTAREAHEPGRRRCGDPPGAQQLERRPGQEDSGPRRRPPRPEPGPGPPDRQPLPNRPARSDLSAGPARGDRCRRRAPRTARPRQARARTKRPDDSTVKITLSDDMVRGSRRAGRRLRSPCPRAAAPRATAKDLRRTGARDRRAHHLPAADDQPPQLISHWRPSVLSIRRRLSSR